ncbi:lipoyl(octanoyl) transferase [Marchantia polymorpha subsp. ruderalis]|uniref:lipoyl(octanoyl) transferase n=2 Tax=Marchantia polymorpha TaxID=3197 RepID=A0AAF6BD99_MARPO|nr:hypothetical protein MARPO_0078s0004 [Marchantia polymorpha]BBN09983.1 hypothetical protein Mp_5g00040 [Marchantia polymorpha subsp. ruderalis]|eukprot:PTQ34576.1 hypothetical protein MARPO_0078s0004 [Marchantia polymorpha]
MITIAGTQRTGFLSFFQSSPTRSTHSTNSFHPQAAGLSRRTPNITSALFVPSRDQRRQCECHDLFKEIVPYVEAWRWQKETVERISASVARGEEPPNSVVLLQHSPVYTMGTRSSDAYLRFDKNHPPFELHQTERGGEVTYHGPGQLVMYPIVNLRQQKMDLHWYLRMLEEVVIRALWSSFSLRASRVDGLTGVWIGDFKVAAIGVRVSRWITYHGLALNVSTDLAPFERIVPCGIADRPVGSVKQLLHAANLICAQDTGPSKVIDSYSSWVMEDAAILDQVHQSLLVEFAEVFQMDLVAPFNKGPMTKYATKQEKY